MSEIKKTEPIKFFENEEAKQRGFAVFDKSWDSVKINMSFYDDVIEHDIYKEAEKITCPTLIFHGDKDMVVPFEQSEKLFDHLKMKDKKLEIIGGADHCYYNSPTLHVATDLLIGWFNKYLQ